MSRKWLGEAGSGRRLLWFVLVLVVASLVPTALTLRTVSNQRYDGVRINLAGRQRMLTQKLSKEILLFAQGRLQAKPVRQTMRAFEMTLLALLHGGRAPLDLGFRSHRRLPPMESGATRMQLQRVVTIWKQFSRHLEDYLAKRDEGSLEYVIQANGALLQEMDRSVSLMQHRAEGNSAFVSNVLLFTVLSALLLLGFLLLRKVAQLRTASARIEKLETLLPICASCKSIRTEAEDSPTTEWTSIEQYLHEEESMEFTHSICPGCREKLYPTSDKSS